MASAMCITACRAPLAGPKAPLQPARTSRPLLARSLKAVPRAAASSPAPEAAAPEACEAWVTPMYCGLGPAELDEAFRQQHPGLLEALAAASAGMTPATAAQLLRRLEAELPPALTDVAPTGDCVFVALQPGLAPLLHRAATCCEAALAGGRLRCAAATARVALRLVSRLRFGGRASAAPYAEAAVRCKQALKAAYDAGAEVRQEDVVDLYSACARASPWLWLTPYAGHRFACAVDDMVTAGWATAELAVRFTEAYASLAGSGRYSQVSGKFVRLVRAALQHPLTVGQVERLLAAERALPVELSIQMDLHERSEPADCCYSALVQRLRQEQRAAAEQAAVEQAATGQANAVPMRPFALRGAAGAAQRSAA